MSSTEASLSLVTLTAMYLRAQRESNERDDAHVVSQQRLTTSSSESGCSERKQLLGRLELARLRQSIVWSMLLRVAELLTARCASGRCGNNGRTEM